MSGFSGMISVRIRGGQARAERFLQRLRVFTLAESLGGVESLANYPLSMTHASVPEERRKHLGISEDLIRLSVGIENASDLLADIRQALE
jgi:cystathionine beta-lyase/cystathionine gamma-synthase